MLRYILSALAAIGTLAAAFAQFAPFESRRAVGLDARFDESMEAVWRGNPLQEDDLAGYGCRELRLLRNAVYARHGRPFRSIEVREYFERAPAYRARPGFSESELTFDDRANVNRIQGAEVSCRR